MVYLIVGVGAFCTCCSDTVIVKPKMLAK